MRLTETEAKLFEAFGDLKVIDAHEHLVPEVVRTAREIDFFILFSHYCSADLASAGMAQDVYQKLRDDQTLPVEKKWELFSPYYPTIKHGSYARPGRIWLNEVLGYHDLTARNCRDISERLQESNCPGLYERVLRGMCRIESALVDNGEHHTAYDMDLLKPLWRITNYGSGGPVRAYLASGGANTLDGYLDWVGARGENLRRVGMFGLKLISFPYSKPQRNEAEAAFRALQDPESEARVAWADRAHLLGAICDRAFEMARRHGLTVAVHSGVWGDFRESHPCHVIPLATAHQDIHFDLFHLGMPFVREAMFVGKMQPNVSLNLCWNSVVSPELTVRMLDECIDMVPINNVIAFGADYAIAVEKVYGHLVMAKEVVARALARRVDRGQMDVEEATRIGELWFYGNPVAIYGLGECRA